MDFFPGIELHFLKYDFNFYIYKLKSINLGMHTSSSMTHKSCILEVLAFSWVEDNLNNITAYHLIKKHIL